MVLYSPKVHSKQLWLFPGPHACVHVTDLLRGILGSQGPGLGKLFLFLA